jgi:hypothetical protein
LQIRPPGDVSTGGVFVTFWLIVFGDLFDFGEHGQRPAAERRIDRVDEWL